MNSSVFSWRRNAKYVDDVLTDEGNAFQARAAATGKARSPRVASRVDGTSSVDVDPDLRRRRDSTSDVRRRVSARYGGALPCRGQEHINEIGFSLEPSASEVLGGVALRVLTSLLRTPVEQQH